MSDNERRAVYETIERDQFFSYQASKTERFLEELTEREKISFGQAMISASLGNKTLKFERITPVTIRDLGEGKLTTKEGVAVIYHRVAMQERRSFQDALNHFEEDYDGEEGNYNELVALYTPRGNMALSLKPKEDVRLSTYNIKGFRPKSFRKGNYLQRRDALLERLEQILKKTR